MKSFILLLALAASGFTHHVNPGHAISENYNQDGCNLYDTCLLAGIELDFGDLLKYNVFTCENFINIQSNPSDVEGRVAVGGHHVVPLGHSIGDKLCPAWWQTGSSLPPNHMNATCDTLDDFCCPGYDSNVLVVGQSSIWTGGRLYFGGACIGDLNGSSFGQLMDEFEQCTFDNQTCSGTNALTPGCSAQSLQDCGIDNSWWDGLKFSAENVSDILYGLTTNAATFYEAVHTHGPVPSFEYNTTDWLEHMWFLPNSDPNTTTHVFEVDASDLASASSMSWAPNPLCTELYNAGNLNLCEYLFTPDNTDYIVINVRSDGASDCSISGVSLQMFEPWSNRLIWNFGECQQDLFFGTGNTGMLVHGMVLAPHADLFAWGQIDGQVFAKSYTGTAQINWFPFHCLEVPEEPNNETCTDYCDPRCPNFNQRCDIVFGCAGKYNVLVFGDFHGSSDVQGRLAVGGHATFDPGFSIADQLFPFATDTIGPDGYFLFNRDNWTQMCELQYGQGTVNGCDMCDECGQSVLVAGSIDNETYTSGRVYFGNWLSHDLSGFDPTVGSRPEYATVNLYKAELLDDSTCGSPQRKRNHPDSFFDIFTDLSDINDRVCQLAPTASTDNQGVQFGGGFLSINLLGDTFLEIVNVNGEDLLNSHTFHISGWAPDSTIIFNVFGDVSGLTSINLESLAPIAHRVLWNFCGATSLRISDVAVHGSVLAPNADIDGGEGVVHGHVFAKSFQGPTQFNWVPFQGCVDYCRPPPTYQCVVNDAVGGDCRGGGQKSFWMEKAGKFEADLHKYFQCNHPDNPDTAIKCTFTEHNIGAPDYDENDPATDPATATHHYGHFVGTACNKDNRDYCLDFDVVFTHYHGQWALANGSWDGLNKDNLQSPKLPDSFKCYDECLLNFTADQCVEPWNTDTCPCVQDGEHWDYWEELMGTAVGHPGSPLECMVAELRRMGPSAQRGWGANLFNVEWGLATWVTFVITHPPCNPDELGDLELFTGYHTDFNFNLDECKLLAPNTQPRTPPNYERCDPTCGVGDLLRYGTCVDGNLVITDGFHTRPEGLSLEDAQQLLDNFAGWCLCRPGWTGPNGFHWFDSQNFNWTLADTCNVGCDPAVDGSCDNDREPQYNDTSLYTECSIKFECRFGDLCEDYGKPQIFTFKYTGDGNDASSHSQKGSKVIILGDPNDEPTVQIIVSDKSDLSNSKTKIFFNDTVNLNEDFTVDSKENPQGGEFKGNTYLFVFDLEGNLIQFVGFHTSCSEPIRIGDQFGSIQIVGAQEGGDDDRRRSAERYLQKRTGGHNPWPSCDENYNFIGEVKICVPEDAQVDVDWESYFYVDTGIVVEQLWGFWVGDWQQDGNVVYVHGAAWAQQGPAPGTCVTAWFRTTKPNANDLVVFDEVVFENVTDDSHCGFFVELEECSDDDNDRRRSQDDDDDDECEDDDFFEIEIGDDKRKRQGPTVSGLDVCPVQFGEGCYHPDYVNMLPPGTNCGELSQITPEGCPVCDDVPVSELLMDNGLTVNQVVENTLYFMNAGTYTVVSVEGDASRFTVIIAIPKQYVTNFEANSGTLSYSPIACVRPKPVVSSFPNVVSSPSSSSSSSSDPVEASGTTVAITGALLLLAA